MRLIDADKLLEAFSNSKHIKETTSGLDVMEMLAIKEIIDNADTYNQVGHRMATAEGFITNPEWHKGDLISREALKEEVENLIGYSLSYEAILNAIDNAPAFEPCYQTTSCLDCKMYDKEKHNCPRFCEVIRSAIEERPQGEWVVDNWGMYHCNYCMKEKQQLFHNFCSNCGAKMKGGAEK